MGASARGCQSVRINRFGPICSSLDGARVGAGQDEVPLSLLILFVLLAAMLALACVAAFGAGPWRSLVVPICVVCLLAAIAGLADGGAASALTLPLGLPGQPAVFAIDRVSLAFLPALAIAGAARASTASTSEIRRLAGLIASALLVVCAGNAALMVIGAGLAALAIRRSLVPVVGLLLAASLAGLLPHAELLPQDSLPALRTQALGTHTLGTQTLGGTLAALLVLVPVLLLTAEAGTGIAGAISPVLGAFLLVRVLLDLCGPATPFAWGAAVAGLGLAGAIERGVRAIRAADLDTVLSGLAGLGSFVAVSGFGVALAARAADLDAIASSALAGALLMVLNLACAVPLAAIASRAVVEQAGSQRLGALGGLSMPMPRTLLAMVVALATMAGLPPAGFAPVWLEAGSLLSAQRFGGLATAIVLAWLLASLGLALGLGFAAGLRLLAIVFGGRPRTPRGAAAAEARPATLRAMAALGGLLVLVGVLPGLVLRFFDPTLSALTGADLASGVLSIVAPDGARWSPPALAALVGVPVGIVLWMGRRMGVRAGGEAPAWDGGAAPPPEWLPFGEPRAQASGPGLARPVLDALGLAAGRLPGEGRDRGPAGVWRPAHAFFWRIARSAGQRAARFDRAMLGSGPAVLACLLAGLLAAWSLAIGGRVG